MEFWPFPIPKNISKPSLHFLHSFWSWNCDSQRMLPPMLNRENRKKRRVPRKLICLTTGYHVFVDGSNAISSTYAGLSVWFRGDAVSAAWEFAAEEKKGFLQYGKNRERVRWVECSRFSNCVVDKMPSRKNLIWAFIDVNWHKLSLVTKKSSLLCKPFYLRFTINNYRYYWKFLYFSIKFRLSKWIKDIISSNSKWH